MNYICRHVFLLIIEDMADDVTPYFLDVFEKLVLFFSKSTLMFITSNDDSLDEWCLSPLENLFLSCASNILSFIDPILRCFGLTHFLLSQECKINFPFGILPTNNSYEKRCAPTVFPFTQKFPYPRKPIPFVNNQQPSFVFLKEPINRSFSERTSICSGLTQNLFPQILFDFNVLFGIIFLKIRSAADDVVNIFLPILKYPCPKLDKFPDQCQQPLSVLTILDKNLSLSFTFDKIPLYFFKVKGII